MNILPIGANLPTKDGRILHVRNATHPEPHQQTLYNSLGMFHQAGTNQGTIQ